MIIQFCQQTNRWNDSVVYRVAPQLKIEGKKVHFFCPITNDFQNRSKLTKTIISHSRPTMSWAVVSAMAVVSVLGSCLLLTSDQVSHS